MLSHLKIIELASVLAGPSAGMFFSELGAEVIKVENPKTGGDVTRSWKLASENPEKTTSAYFASVNYKKHSLFLDLKNESDLNNLFSLLKTADVVICNWKKGDADKFKLSYEEIKHINPKIIYAQISGYGEKDKRVAYDVVLQAETAWMSMNGTKESGPLKIPVAIIDLFAAHQLKEGILVALLKRQQTGNGALVTVNLFDAAVSALANQASNYLMENHITKSAGSLHPNIAPYGEMMLTSDGKKLILAIGSDKQFSELCLILQIPQLITDIRFHINLNRVKNRRILAQLLQERFILFDAEQLLNECNDKNIPVGEIRNIDELFAMPEAQKLILTDAVGSRVKSVVFKIQY